MSLAPLQTVGQANPVRSLIKQAVDESKLTKLSGNVHPLAQPQFDQGGAPASLAMDHMLLVLKRSPEQQAALDTLLAQQQDKSSPNYHKWLTPEQFGQQFGPSDQDVQTVTAWLQSQGFQSAKASTGRTLIDFSGTAGQVQQAFHTAIHRYVMTDGAEHWANASDPQIPTALTPVVAGVSSLNNFPRKPMHHRMGVFRRSSATGKISAVNPQFTFPSQGYCGEGVGSNCYGVAPADLATIYNIPSTTTGAGQTIAIISDSDINLSDLTAFRSLFGLPAATFNQIETGTDPGIEFSNANSDEEEAILDVEWSGAAAPGATLDLVVSPSTNTAFGGDTSAQWVINGNIKPSPSILSYSYGNCELALGTSGNAFYSSLWSQAAAEGITVLVAAGDNGSAGCDDPNINSPADFGLAVTGQASTPYNVAVGGTDFNDLTVAQANTYWNASNNATTQASAKGYIPETTYNDSCTNSLIYASNGLFGFSNFASGELACNSSAVAQFFLFPTGGSGGVSNCTTNSTTATSTTLAVSSCSGGYAKPSWQTGPGVPNDGKRDLPDVSLFAGDSTIQNFYIVCESDLAAADANTGQQPCSLASPFQDFVGVGGTSVSAQVFAGVAAMIDQKFGGAQGNVNPTLYALAGEQAATSCNSSSSPASTCVFYDITAGTNAMPCVKGTPNCTVQFSNDTVGTLSGYNAGAGYDLATGLGSVNVANLLNKWGPNFSLSSSSPAVTIANPGASGTLSVTATSVNGFSGAIALACSGLPSGATCSFSPASPLTLSASGSATTTVTINTTAASGTAANYRGGPGAWAKTREVALLLALCLGLLLIGTRDSGRRLSTAAAIAVLTILIGSAACGGGSSSSGTGTTGATGATTATVTGTSSAGVAFSMNFTVTIQ